MWSVGLAGDRLPAPRRPGEFALPGLLAAALVLSSCAPESRLEEWTLALEEMTVLGEAGDGPQSSFFNPMDLAFDGNGRLYVLDGGNDRVQVFDAEGKYLATRGRSGSGPGDLSRPSGMWVYPDGELLVADTGNGRIQRYGPSGEPLPAMKLDFLPLDVVGTDRRLFVLRLPPPTYVYGPDPTPLVQVFDRDGLALGAHVTPESAEVGILYFLLNTLRIAAAPGGGFALANTHVYSRIRLFDAAGNPQREIPTLYKAAALAPLGRLPKLLNDESLTRVAKTALDLCWDPDRGMYWVLSGYVDRTREGKWVTARELYRYDADGNYRGTIVLPFRAVAVAASPDRTLWLLDEEGLAHRFRLRDPDVAPIF